MIRSFNNHTPQVAETVHIDPTSSLIGAVEIGAGSSVWPQAVIRGDVHTIKIGRESNIQDGSILHVTHASKFNAEGFPLTVGDRVTVGHRVVLHGCTVGAECLIGIAAVVLDGAILEDQVMLGAGTLVPPGKRLESRFLYVGVPAVKRRALTDEERDFLGYSARHYAELARYYIGESD